MSENWVSNGLCRCCHIEGKFLSLNTIYSSKYMYAEMLKETFGIQILSLLDTAQSLTYSICDVCITKLEDAYTFKQQVISCEDVFMKWYNKDKLKVGENAEGIKLEICETLENMSDPIDSDDETEQTFPQLPLSDSDDPIDSDDETEQTFPQLPLSDSDVSEMKTEIPTRKKKITKQNTISTKCKYNGLRYKVMCNICGLKFAHNEQLINHTNIRHPGEKHTSTTCQKTFQNTTELKKHLVTNVKELKCPVCYKVLKKNCYNEHLKLHEALKFICNVCGKMFWQQSQLFRHSAIHTGTKPFTCAMCNKKFTRKASLETHIRRHTGEKPFKCDVCEKTFTDPSSMMVHTRLHSGSKPYMCSFCSLCFTQASNLRSHERTHTGERPYSCDTCGKTFSTPSAMKPHMRTHTGEKPYKCDLCTQSFSEKQYLKRHLNTHNGTKPYTCRICNKQVSGLNKHMRVVHSGEKPFQCAICDKRFADRDYLKLHLRTHTGERPFGCDVCGKKFTQSHVLKNHRCGNTDVSRKKK